MFETLSDRLSGIFDKLTGRGALGEADVDAALGQVRLALLEADVALDVARDFVADVKVKIVGAEVVKSVTPGQMVVKLVHDQLSLMLGAVAEPIDLNAPAPVSIMMVGLQGSGKTTTSAKIALRLKDKNRKKVLLASLDTRRPAAQEQLRVLGAQVGVDTLDIVAGETPTAIAQRASRTARTGGYDVVILDTAGRTTLDDEMMAEAAAIEQIAAPHEVILVADSLTGQDAVNTAKAFGERVKLTGIVLTRADGDARGGAALSMRAVTGKPIKLLGTGEKMDALEQFDPARVAGRILGMGDIVALVEKAQGTIDQAEAAKIAARMSKGVFTLDDMSSQLSQMTKMGGLAGVMGMLPGMAKIKDKVAGAIDEHMFKRQMAIISSMTFAERDKPHKILTFSRKKRIAAGSGTSLEDINKLLKMHRGMADMMKSMGGAKKGGVSGMMGKMLGMGSGLPGAGGMPQPSPEDLAALQGAASRAQMPKGMPRGFTPPGGFKLPGLGATNFGGLPGLPKKTEK